VIPDSIIPAPNIRLAPANAGNTAVRVFS
jgi:hypothetical protein